MSIFPFPISSTLFYSLTHFAASSLALPKDQALATQGPPRQGTAILQDWKPQPRSLGTARSKSLPIRLESSPNLAWPAYYHTTDLNDAVDLIDTNSNYNVTPKFHYTVLYKLFHLLQIIRKFVFFLNDSCTSYSSVRFLLFFFSYRPLASLKDDLDITAVYERLENHLDQKLSVCFAGKLHFCNSLCSILLFFFL